MIDKFIDPIFSDWKEYLKKQNSIHFINFIFILGLLVLWLGPSDRNISIKLADFNITKMVGNLQIMLYSLHFFQWEVGLSILSVLIIMFLWDKTLIQKLLPESELINGKTVGYSGQTAINRIILINYWYFHNIWIVLFFIDVLHNSNYHPIKNIELDFSLYDLIFWVNVIILLLTLIKALFSVENDTYFYGRIINYRESIYVELSHKKVSNSTYFLLKNTIMKPNLFYLVKEIHKPFSYEAEIVNYSPNLDEIQYQFEMLNSTNEQGSTT
ncbi:hypothetical protein [Limosilactobacillus reuteri]|uniref:hypothetical protein n=1 Tax=Limosilactobacillus reuteri TaxID=1598 RepID=UPI001C5A5F66|nr:hypothetical protein [Limosilactobacillus reuteri]MBW3350773.1 hypothetical protein [Limosilactobacillus reuteri]UUW68215.1 hypothetical protein NUJ10_09460 [Limosilactobacillus reuteri]